MKFANLSIRNKIALVSIIQFTVVIILVGLILNLFVSKLTVREVRNNLLATAQSRSSHIETYLKDNIQLLQLVTSRTALRKALASYNETGSEADLATLTNIIKDAITPIAQFERICILGLSGKVVASTSEGYCGKDASSANFFIGGLKSEGIYFLEEEGGYKLYISGPMILDDKVIGVGMTVLRLDGLEDIVSNRTGLGETGEVLVAFHNAAGEREYPVRRLFEEAAAPLNVQNEEIAYPMKQALAGKADYFENALDYRNQKVEAASSFIEIANLGLVAKIDRSEILEINRQILMLILVIFIIFFFVYYFISKKVSYFISKPIADLHRGIEQIGGGNLDYKVGTQAQDEIGQLSRSFDSMVESIAESRAEVDKRVEEQTKELSSKTKVLENQKSAILNILEDVEEEKEKSQQLASDLEKFKLAVENASDHIVITDAEGIILYANKGVERITGFSSEEVLGHKAGSKENWGGLMDEKVYQDLWQKIKKEKKAFVGELKNHRKNGEEYDVKVGISPILDEKGEVVFFVGIELDVTKERQVDKAKTEFVSLASHQLRTPLSAINWYAEMLLAGDAGKLSKKQKDFVDEIYNGNQRMVSLVNALLNVSRIELGTLAIDPKPTDFSAMAESVLGELKKIITEKELVIESKYDNSLPQIDADPNIIRIIFQNLLTNSVKYTPEKGKVMVVLEKKEPNILIKIADTGYGIPSDQKERIFEKMFRADNVKERDAGGTGLGLYLVKAIVEDAGGKIWFESPSLAFGKASAFIEISADKSAGKKETPGTTFFITLPLSGMQKKEGSKTLSEEKL